jgi:hypothetical protein
MPSSISSFDPGEISSRNARLILLGLLAGILMILAAENLIRIKGGEPNVKDTAELWASERARASALGNQALILVGSSQIQLDTDLEVLAETTGLKPVQLAIDGSPYLDVLENLASDPDIVGTILISTTLPKLSPGENSVRVNKWINTYETKFRGLWSPFIEQFLKSRLQYHSALYANLLPVDELIERLISKAELRKVFLTTYPSRERDADYSLVKMPDYYFKRVERSLGHAVPRLAYASYEAYSDAVVRIARENHRKYNTNPEKYRRIKQAINTLQQRGVQVIISRFPQSGLVEAITEIRYPESLWENVVKDFGVRVIDYRDYPQLQFQLPDGSHLDKTQKKEFTSKFSRILVSNMNE